MNRTTRIAFACLLALVAAPAFARSPGPAQALPDWDHLSAEQREMLIAPVRERWNARPADRPRMLGHAKRWKSMTPEQRARARHGVDRFQSMSPEQRAEARRIFEHMRGMPPEERRALRERLRRMTPEERRAWLKSQPMPAR